MSNVGPRPLERELGLPHPILEPLHAVVMEIIITSSMMAKEGDRLLRPFRMTETQMNVLMLLHYQSPEHGLDQSSLGRMLVVNRANVTGLIDRMERDGLVTRRADSFDRRLKRVQLTRKGLGRMKEAERAYIARVREIMGSLSPAERQGISIGLERVRGALRRKG
ncbi:MAG: MarR family transcriptional regulator [Elusimicrobia bacterium]|nr:MarR family transcriptional regulator [Elusimicrobiota bacterium]